MKLVAYQREHAGAFKALNMAWITAYWEPEAADFKLLDHPQTNIIDPGGHVVVAVEAAAVLGVCALIKISDSCFELAKMAVAEHATRRGVGESLGAAVIDKARALGATRVFLESNTVLKPAMRLYGKLGFNRVPIQPSSYQRCNIQMELLL